MKNPRTARILIVEDDRSTRETIAKALKSEGYLSLAQCSSADEAMFYLFRERDLRVDLALVELALPNSNGLRFVRKVHDARLTWRRTLPVILLTPDTENETFRAASRLGARGYVRRPVGRSELLDTVAAVLAAHGFGHPTPAQAPQALAPLAQPAIAAAPEPVPADDGAIPLPPSLDDGFQPTLLRPAAMGHATLKPRALTPEPRMRMAI